MNPGIYALLERIHGHLAMLGLAVLLHPVITLGRGRLGVGGRWSVGILAGILAVASAMGWWLYGEYRASVKPALVRHRLDVALAFEVKEHLAYLCLVLAICGAAALLAAPGHPPTLRLARRMLGLAWILGLAVAVLGLLVSASAAPGW